MSQTNQRDQRTITELTQNIRTSGFMLGRASGVSEAANFLRAKAGDEFICGNDEMAIYLRDLAAELDELSDGQRKSWHKDYAGKEDEAFSLLEDRQHRYSSHPSDTEKLFKLQTANLS